MGGGPGGGGVERQLKVNKQGGDGVKNPYWEYFFKEIHVISMQDIKSNILVQSVKAYGNISFRGLPLHSFFFYTFFTITVGNYLWF